MSNKKLDIFISWSKPLAGQIANQVLNSLKIIFETKKNELDIFLSSVPENGIEAGKNFHLSLNEKLYKSDFGILILTEYNQNSEWIMFEAGALSKNPDSYVIPFLFNRDIMRREKPIQSLQYYTFEEESFIDLAKTIQRVLLKKNHSNLSGAELDSLINFIEKRAKEQWKVFKEEVELSIENYVESPDDLSTMDLIMDEKAYDIIVSKREEHLKELIEGLDKDTEIKRIIIFGGIATILMEETTLNAFGRWLAKDHRPKLYFCQETLNALLERTQDLNETVVSADDAKRAEKAIKKIKKIKDMNSALLKKIGEDYKSNIFFINLEVMPSNFITISGDTIYLTPALDKRSSDTFTFKLSKNSKLNHQLLDYMVSKINANESRNKSLLDEIGIIKNEIGEKNEK